MAKFAKGEAKFEKCERVWPGTRRWFERLYGSAIVTPSSQCHAEQPQGIWMMWHDAKDLSCLPLGKIGTFREESRSIYQRGSQRVFLLENSLRHALLVHFLPGGRKALGARPGGAVLVGRSDYDCLMKRNNLSGGAKLLREIAGGRWHIRNSCVMVCAHLPLGESNQDCLEWTGWLRHGRGKKCLHEFKTREGEMSSKGLSMGSSALALLAAGLLSTAAFAQRAVDPLPGQAHHVGPYQAPYVAPAGIKSGKWSSMKNKYPGTFPETSLLLTDGTVIVHEGCTGKWYKLTPDNNGSYQNGTWKQTASMQSGYAPLYFASQVLPDGRVIVNGGEYNSCNGVWTTLGSLYDPVKDSWTSVSPPNGWTTIGDAQSIVRSDKTYQLANCCDLDSALATISGTTVTWNILTSSQTHKADDNDEEGWTILPNQTVLTVDTWNCIHNSTSCTEIFDPSTNTWSAGNDTCAELTDPSSHEIGPGPLLPNGFVFYAGGTAKNCIMDTSTGTWSNAPSFGSNDSADGPAAVLPNGNALFQVSPGVFNSPSHFYEAQVIDANTVNVKQVDEPASASGQSSYEGRLLVLPSGQILWTSDVNDVEIYTPTGKPQRAWKPRIKSVAATLSVGSKNNKIKGKNFNGFTFGGYYGDDVQMATNFPIVRITNTGSGHICYARTHDHSTMGISNGGPTSTQFDIPSSCETGASTIQVIANGIASSPKSVTLQ